MTIIDFVIGLTLMNAMPHWVLGIWKGRMLSGFGVGDTKNMVYGLFNFSIAISLYTYKYGLSSIGEQGIFAGALFVLLMYFFTGKFFYQFFKKKDQS